MAKIAVTGQLGMGDDWVEIAVMSGLCLEVFEWCDVVISVEADWADESMSGPIQPPTPSQHHETPIQPLL